MIVWNIPPNIAALVAADPDKTWESVDFEPIRLSVIGGTAYAGRPIPLAWQIEFDPDDVANTNANDLIGKLGHEPDGYGWAALISAQVAQRFPELEAQLHLGDTEEATCVIWVEGEDICRKLCEVALGLVVGG